MLRVQIYLSLEDSNSIEGDLDCNESPISFVYSPTDEDKAPYFLVYSFNSRVDEIDHKALFDRIDPTVRCWLCVLS